MTLSMPPGEDIMVSTKDGDADSGCFAESCEDGKDGSCNLKEGCLTPDLKRQQDVQDHMSTPSPDHLRGLRHNSSSYGEDDHPSLWHPDDTDSSPDGTLDKTPSSNRSPTNPLVTYTCNVTDLVSPSTVSCDYQTQASSLSSCGGVVATPRPSPDCGGGGDGATQGRGATTAAPVLLPPQAPSPTHHSIEGSTTAQPSDPVTPHKDLTTRDITINGQCNPRAVVAASKEILPDTDVRSGSILAVIDTSDSSVCVPVCSNDTDSDYKSRHATIDEQHSQNKYNRDIVNIDSEINNISSDQKPLVDGNGLQAAKQKLVTMRQNFLFSLATSETCDTKKAQVVKSVSDCSAEHECISDTSDPEEPQLEVLGVHQGAWQPHAATPSSDSNRKSSLENWTRELQARKRPPLTGVHHRENIARSEAGSRRASECSEGTEAAGVVGGQNTTIPLTSVSPVCSRDRGRGNLSPRCDIPDDQGDHHRVDTDRLLSSSSSLIHTKEQEEGVEYSLHSQENVNSAHQEHSQQLVSCTGGHERGGSGNCSSRSSKNYSSSSSSTCGGDVTSQPSKLTLTHQSPAVVVPRGHHEHKDRIAVPHGNNQCLNTPLVPNVASYHNKELYQRPPPPQFSKPSGDTTDPSIKSVTKSRAGCPNKDSLSSPGNSTNKCGLVIALTGDPVGVDVRIVKNKVGKLVKVQDERPKIENIIKSNKVSENIDVHTKCIEHQYIEDLDEVKSSSYGNYIKGDGRNSDTSCVGLLHFDKYEESNSDVEINEHRKRRLSEACKDIARAFDALPTPQEENSLNTPIQICKVPTNFRGKSPMKHKYQEIEACLSDDSVVQEQIVTSVRSCGTSTASEDERRSSFYDNCCTEDSSCDCRQCLTSEAEEESVMSQVPHHSKSAKEVINKKDIINGDTSDCEEDGFRTDAGDGCRTDEFDPVSSEDNDDDDDYCQTDDCGDDCDYCSGDDAEDEGEKEDITCYYCKNAPNMIAGCKHPGVITNGILRSYGSYQRSGEKHRMARQRPLVLQAAIQRRRLSRRGLVAIRESSITSDENISEEDSYDGSICDISSSWRYGLHQDVTSSRSSTLKSEKSRSSTLKSEKSSSSAPMERAHIRAKEKSNSLPMNMRRSSGLEAMKQHSNAKFVRYPSTSEEESGSVSSLGLRLPPRPPRTPKIRPLLLPSPPSSLVLEQSPHTHLPSLTPTSPQPCMGLQGLQQRSPNTPKNPHASGIAVIPRSQVAPRSPCNPNPPYGFPLINGNALLCPSNTSLHGRSTPSSVEMSNTSTTERGRSTSPRVNNRAGALVTRNFSISDDEKSARWTGGRRHVTISRHESVYKEVAEHGYVLPPGSPVDPYWLTWKLGVLQKTLEDVSCHLEEAEKTVATWGSIPRDSNLADQHSTNVRNFRDDLADLQRGVDDVNDQAARFSAHNVPLTSNNSAKFHDLNNRWKTLETSVNDRWLQLVDKSREATPFTPAQLTSSVVPPWVRATTNSRVPYYINHEQESTHWDHPLMLEMLDELNEFNHIKFSAYRTASKLRALQKKLALDHANMQIATDLFDEHGLRGQNDRLIDINDMMVVLSALYSSISADHPEVNIPVAMDLCLNWLLNVYDSQRTGQMRVLSFKIGLICLCRGHLEEKYRYMFRLIADPNRLVDQRKLGLLLHDCVQVPRQLGEVAAFGGSNIEPSVRSCFAKAGKDRETVEAMHFLSWVQQEPQSLVWLAVLHRVAASENIIHQVKCNICKTCPIVGLRYRCLKCLSFDMCQRCFFDGRSGKSHKVTHPMHEYCTATTAGEDVKDFTKALKNKFKSKRSLQKHTKKGYLPVQTVLEGDAMESPSSSLSHNMNSQDMHSRLEAYASRLAEVELRKNSNSTPDRYDEHGLIVQYCQSLGSSDAPIPVLRSPGQIMADVDADQKDELEQMIRDLEDENQILQTEYDRLKSQQPAGFPSDDLSFQCSETEMLAEAKLLREHKGLLQDRMGNLEDHNRKLEAQLIRLRELLGESGDLTSRNSLGTLKTKSVTASQLAMDSPVEINGLSKQGGANVAYDGLEHMNKYVRPPPPPLGNVAHVENPLTHTGKSQAATMNNLNNEDDDDKSNIDSEIEESIHL